MSSNLRAEPTVRKNLDLDTQLKFALRKRYGEPVSATMSKNHIDYLTGLKDAGIKDAEKLIDFIEKHDEIFVKEEY